MRVFFLPKERSDDIKPFVLNTMELCVAFCGDNTNINFGGLERKGKINLFTKLKAAL